MNKRLIPDPPFAIPSGVWRDTIQPIRNAGANGYECFVLWFGRVEDERMRVRHSVVPRQMSSHVGEGCYVRVEGGELFRLSVLAHDRQELICAQVHAHPHDAYHSEVDETSPLVALPGALSIVLPGFAAPPISPHEWAVFQLQETGDWHLLAAAEALNIDQYGLS